MSFCFCRLAVWRSKKNCIHSPVRLNRSKNIASVHPFDSTVRKNCICSPVRLYRSKKCCIRSVVQPTFRIASLSSRLLSVCLPCVRPFERIMPFVHSPKGKALVLAVHSRETRLVSRETRLVSRETRHVSSETRRVSRDGGNLHLSGTVCLPCVRPFERIMPFVHSPKGKALVLAVHSRETRLVSRETRLVSRETRHVSRETRRVSRDGGNLHLSGTVML